MDQQQVLQDFSSLPPFAQQEVVDFIVFLQQKYTQKSASSTVDQTELPPLETEPFVGMWKDRNDLADSSAWVRNRRQSEWG